MSTPSSDPPAGVPLSALIRIGREVELRARRLGARAMSVELLEWDGFPAVFSCEHGGVWVTGLGYEVELSGLPEWELERPPGA